MTDVLDRPRKALADRYSREREFGSGGMATVYHAQDLKHERQVAMKVLRPELAAALGAERFLQEIKIAANLHHPHILPLYDSGEAGGFLYYVMPCVEGDPLRDRLARERQPAIDDALQIAREVADALSYAHSHGVIHRDIKPREHPLGARARGGGGLRHRPRHRCGGGERNLKGYAMKTMKRAVLTTVICSLAAIDVCLAVPQQAEERCQNSVVRFETSTLERIVGEPDSVLDEGEEFWTSERPLILVQGWADEVGSRDPYGRFRERVSGLARLSEEERVDHPLLRMTEAIVARQDAWRDKALLHLCSYLPADVDLSRPAYFVAFVPPRAFATSDGNVIDVASGYWRGNPDNILNSLVHEYFHIGYGQLRRQRSEEPLENAELYRMLDMVHNEGLAVWVAYRAQSLFPAPTEVDNELLDDPEDVTRLLGALNELLAQSTVTEAEELRRLAWRVGVTNRAYYVVGAHMARTIEAERGRDAVIGTLHEGPLAYVTLYNSLVPEERRVRLPE